MKTTDHLKSLIVDLELYERELKDKVQQKETELELLLRRLLPVSKETNNNNNINININNTNNNITNNNLQSRANSLSLITPVCQLRITRPTEKVITTIENKIKTSTNKIKNSENEIIINNKETPAISRSPSITEESRQLRPRRNTIINKNINESSILIPHTLLAEKYLLLQQEENNNNNNKKSKEESNISVGIEDISSILETSDASTDSDNITKSEFLLTIRKEIEEKEIEVKEKVKNKNKTRPKRRVRFVSRSPQINSIISESPIHSFKEKKITLKPRGTPLPNSTLSISKEENNNNINDYNGDDDDDDEPCYLRRQHQEFGNGNNNNSNKNIINNISTDVVLPRVSTLPHNSEKINPQINRFRNNRQQNSIQSQQIQQPRTTTIINVSNDVFNMKRQRENNKINSRSVSAARSNVTNIAQEEGRGAGIVLASGPTLFFD